ncbi:MAG: DUF6132 family protein [Bacteroidales bacterium]|nr:DUF6132 family protein [Bacteroidales bacterium]
MTNFFHKHKYAILLTILGSIAGYIYWKYIGCASGTCPIKSNWYLTLLFGAFLGYFAGDGIDNFKRKRKN